MANSLNHKNIRGTRARKGEPSHNLLCDDLLCDDLLCDDLLCDDIGGEPRKTALFRGEGVWNRPPERLLILCLLALAAGARPVQVCADLVGPVAYERMEHKRCSEA